jgi:hypothetical protein
MSTSEATPEQAVEAPPRHPFPAALQARDHAALVDTLAPDVVLHPAVTRTTFDGKETVADVYAAVIDSFEEVKVVDELSSDDTHVFFWRGTIEGRFVEGADRLRLDGEGKVREITVVGRPLSGLATFLTGIGARFARGRRGPTIAMMLRLTARPLPPLFAGLDPITRWMGRPRRRSSER